jgi:hypothetical protein
MKPRLLSKSELAELMDDLCVYSGHIRGFRGIKKQKYADGFVQIEGKVMTWMEEFRFQIIPYLEHKEYWTIHLEDARASLDSGNCVFSAYSFPRLKANPELKKKIQVANLVIQQITGTKPYSGPGATEKELQPYFDFLGVPKAFDLAQKVKYCQHEIKEAHLRKIQYAKN